MRYRVYLQESKRDLRNQFIDQSLDFLPAAPASISIRFVFQTHEPS